ncbi:Xanthine phosphoribosyltransferase [Fructilactobacillus florum 8D]|uniref:Xanthine phosphoribosyltransferase n=1 Tax=Fructilactobacillus florum 8D TaxID=1221538 RepID=W9EL99_9LACO|nr:xanthine phosphoribosyltransferase [Fructilactobacillus florum]EKK20806.1 Xanthine phosphoribosyltransferase [Fructilactobacillus florum 2F]ETO40444.1 Xanthine phosphoribosyltransferase [Fructilactobacillus florum 8D]
MKQLEQAIFDHGTVLPGNILKVNSFLNHQLDPELMQAIGIEFATRFKSEAITKVVTIEASGIAPAVMTGLALKVPVVFARKSKSLTVHDHVYQANVVSYTKQTETPIYIEQQFLAPTDHVLIIDDFLANGEAVKGLLQIIAAAHATVSGIGIVIEKSFQPGAKWLHQQHYRLQSLARIKSLDNQTVTFLDDEPSR